ncbi:MAG: hypothetical protein FWE84_05735 [Firmicutes bacterium]|nr:hypothetical protein [Bacillota bacterium]
MQNYSELKKRALLAKQRMKMGYWQQLMDEREKMLSKVGNTEQNVQLISEVQRAEIKRDANVFINNPVVSRDEALYKRVKLILDENEYVSNPIGRLIDKDEYERLDDGGRQRYVLELSRKYSELRERYYKEKTSRNNA